MSRIKYLKLCTGEPVDGIRLEQDSLEQLNRALVSAQVLPCFQGTDKMIKPNESPLTGDHQWDQARK